jgi:hypothetical protein
MEVSLSNGQAWVHVDAPLKRFPIDLTESGT